MKRISIEEIIRATGGQLVDLTGQPIIKSAYDRYVTGIKHDSRLCETGDMFVAIRGENQDGHKYIPSVAEAGCLTFLVSHTENWTEQLPKSIGEYNIIKVEDTIKALGDLAAWYLETLQIKKIAVTGSVGKTSTRDLIYYVMNEKYNCGRNLKNYNNNIGLPISIFQFDENTEAAVLEMGMDAFGEIEYLSEIVKPQVGVITNIGVAHMEKLGSREGIFKAKMEITKNIAPRNQGGALVYAGDEEFLTKDRTRGDYSQFEIINVTGESELSEEDAYLKSSDFIISNVDDFGVDGIQFNLAHKGENATIKLPIPGTHNAINAAIAVACGSIFGISLQDAANGLSKAELTGSRLKVIDGKSIKIIDDTYNANPYSMMSALDVMVRSECKRAVAILGDMFELGDEERKLHRKVGEHAKSIGIDSVIAVGELAAEIAIGACGKYVETKEELINNIDSYIKPGDLVLVKASRGMHMEEIVEALERL